MSVNDYDPENLLNIVRRLQDDMESLKLRFDRRNSLAEGTNVLGEVRSGRIIAGEGDPEDGTLLGEAGCWPAVEYPAGSGQWWTRLLMDGLGNLQIGFDAITGKFRFGNGSGILGASGIELNGYKSLFTQRVYDYSSLTELAGVIDMAIPQGFVNFARPAWRMALQSYLAETAIEDNGNLESGDDTNWQLVNDGRAVGEPNDDFIRTENPYDGAYCLYVPDDSSGYTGYAFPYSGQAVDGSMGGFIKVKFAVRVESAGSSNPRIWLEQYSLAGIGAGPVKTTVLFASSISSDDGWLYFDRVVPLHALAKSVRVLFSSFYTPGKQTIVVDAVQMLDVNFYAGIEVYDGGDESRVDFYTDSVYRVKDSGEPETALFANARLPKPWTPSITLVATSSGTAVYGTWKIKLAYYDAYGEVLSDESNAVTTNSSNRKFSFYVPPLPEGATNVRFYASYNGGVFDNGYESGLMSALTPGTTVQFQYPESPVGTVFPAPSVNLTRKGVNVISYKLGDTMMIEGPAKDATRTTTSNRAASGLYVIKPILVTHVLVDIYAAATYTLKMHYTDVLTNGWARKLAAGVAFKAGSLNNLITLDKPLLLNPQQMYWIGLLPSTSVGWYIFNGASSGEYQGNFIRLYETWAGTSKITSSLPLRFIFRPVE